MTRLDRANNRRQFVDAGGPVQRVMMLKCIDLFVDWYEPAALSCCMIPGLRDM
jgi:hypothetical protein